MYCAAAVRLLRVAEDVRRAARRRSPPARPPGGCSGCAGPCSTLRMVRASSTSAAQVGAGALLAGREPQHGILEPGVDQIILQRALVLEVLLGLAARHLVERRLRDEEMAAVDDLAHLAVEERQQQRADMRAVDVGVRHDDDLVVAQLVGVELVVADAGAERRDQRADLLGRQHLVEAHALDVEDLAAQRQHGLEFAVAALLGGAAGRVALDDEQFGFRRIALLAVGELAGQRGDVERALAARQFARLARGFARGGGLDHLADDDLGFGGVLLEPGLQRVVDHALDHRADFGGDELVLGLRGEFRVRHLHESTAVRPSRQSSPVSATFSFCATPPFSA